MQLATSLVSVNDGICVVQSFRSSFDHHGNNSKYIHCSCFSWYLRS